MGTYLSSPILDKSIESGDDLQCPSTPLSYACIEMQGWRKTMEDAHVAQVSIDRTNNLKAKVAKVFAVFDGHGGPEVARFCQRYLVEVLVNRVEWKEGDDFGKALVETFHELDRMIDHPERREELMSLKTDPSTPHRLNLAHQPPLTTSRSTNPHRPQTPPPLPKQRRGQKEKSPTSKKKALEGSSKDDIDIMTSSSSLSSSGVVAFARQKPLPPDDKDDAEEKKEIVPDHIQDEEDEEDVVKTTPATEEEEEKEEEERPIVVEENNEESQQRRRDTVIMTPVHPDDNDDDDPLDPDADKPEEESNEDEPSSPQIIPSDEDDDSSDDDSKNGTTTTHSLTTADAMVIFHKLLTMSGANVQIDDASNDDDDDDKATEEETENQEKETKDTTATAALSPQSSMRPTTTPSRIINGRHVCNLPDHPIHAGCTSVVVVMVDRTVYVANAGDSRAVLCRKGGVVEPLSFDHKPLQERERVRITEAGGFVNQFGRVNGNLNLSRSIGDLKYKQTAGLPMSRQMITAEPDIIQVTLDPEDEFIIIGCDGIWDCLTNEQAVQYVRDRLDTKTSQDIGIEMLDDIVSQDPRATQGIGGDNMTCLIVDLLPMSRSYRTEEKEEEGDVVVTTTEEEDEVKEESPEESPEESTEESSEEDTSVKDELVTEEQQPQQEEQLQQEGSDNIISSL